MESKKDESNNILQDGAIINHTWESIVPKIFLFLVLLALIMPWTAISLLTCLLWFVSLGHLNLQLRMVDLLNWTFYELVPEDGFDKNKRGNVQKGQFVTAEWKFYVVKGLLFVVSVVLFGPWLAVELIALAIWLVSLGHVNFNIPVQRAAAKFMDRVSPDEELDSTPEQSK